MATQTSPKIKTRFTNTKGEKVTVFTDGTKKRVPAMTEDGAIDVSQIKDGVEPVQLPGSSLRDLSIAFSGNASDTTMADIETRDPALANVARQFSSTGQFVAPPPEEVTPVTGKDRLVRDADAITSEIRTLEEKMANSEQNRTDAYDQSGVFDDMRLLNKLKDDLRTAQDREIEIPIEGRQILRGRTATKTEFNQLTNPALEKNLLEQLSASRATSRLTDTINTNIAIVDSKIKAENDRNQFLYTQKVGQLETIQKAYADIITEEQKAAAEAKKFEYDLILEASKSDNALRNDLIKDIAKSGRFSGTDMNQLLEMSSDELLGLSYDTTSPFNWTNLSPEDAALYLDEDTYDRYITYSENKSNLTKEQDEAFKIKSTNLQTANSTIDLIEDLLDDEAGLKTSVGEGALGRTDFSIPFTSIGKESNKFRANMKQLLSQATLNKLLELKAAGGTLGAISEKELEILGKAAVALGSVETKEGLASGKSNLSEADFKTALETLRMASMKVYIAERLGSQKYSEAGFVDMGQEDFDTIEKLYKDLKATPLKEQNYADDELRSGENLSTAFNKIRQEEGLRTDAYQDSTGTWTIGFGNTTINGRPVRPGDRLTERQAEALMQQTVVEKYTTFADRVNTEVTPNQFAALTSFEYNLGSGVWQSDTGRQILALVNQGRNDEAGRLMLQYNKSKNPATGQLEVNRVLAQRRMREANLLLS
jgi:GH24 family phage-related lysozyme (muramidase)